MKPLPKWIGFVAAAGSVASALAALVADPAIAAVVPQKYLAVIAGVCGVVATLSHSLTGTGGK